MPKIVITDDGDEHCIVTVDGKLLSSQPINHEDLGWSGMEEILRFVHELADALGVEVDNRQGIV